MLNWARKGLGLKEEIHGPDAIKPVGLQVAETPYTVTSRDDHKWAVLEETNVETKTFYVFTDDGHIAMYQVVYSSLMGMKKTATVNVKIFPKQAGEKVVLWNTDELKSWSWSDDKADFKGEYSSATISADGTSYHLKTQNKQVSADLTFTQAAPGFKVGENGTTTFGTDPAAPWGRMIHHFWPRCTVSGMISGNGTVVDVKGRGMYAYALQGMKPHFAASRWNFFTFQGPTYSAILMEFITPPAYENTVVSVGGVAKDGEILLAGASPATSAKHDKTQVDKKNKLDVPTDVTYTIADGSSTATASGPVGTRLDLIDIMGELPLLVKNIATSASGTQPYIYQFGPQITLNISGAKQGSETGPAFAEATYIS